MDDAVLAELRLLREQVAALVQELRGNRRRASKRSRTIKQKRTAPIASTPPSPLDIAAVRRALSRR